MPADETVDRVRLARRNVDLDVVSLKDRPAVSEAARERKENRRAVAARR